MYDGLILLAHSVHAAIRDQAMLAALPSDVLSLPRHTAQIDAVAVTIADTATFDWADAGRLQAEQFDRVVKPLIEAHPRYRVLYFGAAPVPLAVHLGYLVGGWPATHVFLHHHERKDWRWGGPVLGAPNPIIRRMGIPTDLVRAEGDVVIRVSTSHGIDPSDTAAVVSNALAEVDIALAQPYEDALATPENVAEVTKAFKETLDVIAKLRPNAHSIHLFAAVPVGLAFSLGTQIRSTLHPSVQTYQYHKSRAPRYRHAVAVGQPRHDRDSVAHATGQSARAIRLVGEAKTGSAAAGPAIELRKTTMKTTSDELVTTDELLQHGKIRPWNRIAQSDYFRKVTTFGSAEQEWVLDKLQRFGFAQVRYQGTEPTRERLLSVEYWLGPAREKQNNHIGKIKSITPQEAIEATTGDSAKELLPHVDGTQDPTTPAILVFEYETTPTYGGNSTFIDMSRILLEIPEEERTQILAALSQPDAAVSEKKGLKYEGPLIRVVCGGAGIAVRLRFDPPTKPVMRVNPRYQREFEALQQRVLSRTERLIYSPEEGDIVFFDNWRLLHGRAAVGGRHLRFHNRMWIDQLASQHQGEYLLGVRGLPPATIALVESINGPLGTASALIPQAIASDQTLWELLIQKEVRLEPLHGLPEGPQSSDMFRFRVESVSNSAITFKKTSNVEAVVLPFEALGRPWGGDSGGWRATIKSGRLTFNAGREHWEWAP